MSCCPTEEVVPIDDIFAGKRKSTGPVSEVIVLVNYSAVAGGLGERSIFCVTDPFKLNVGSVLVDDENIPVAKIHIVTTSKKAPNFKQKFKYADPGYQ
jgi:hypothetical protein